MNEPLRLAVRRLFHAHRDDRDWYDLEDDLVKLLKGHPDREVEIAAELVSLVGDQRYDWRAGLDALVTVESVAGVAALAARLKHCRSTSDECDALVDALLRLRAPQHRNELAKYVAAAASERRDAALTLVGSLAFVDPEAAARLTVTDLRDEIVRGLERGNMTLAVLVARFAMAGNGALDVLLKRAKAEWRWPHRRWLQALVDLLSDWESRRDDKVRAELQRALASSGMVD